MDISFVLHLRYFDPLGRLKVMAGRDHCFFTCPSVPTFQNLTKQSKVKAMYATGETVGLAEWIIDDTCAIFMCYYFEASMSE